MTLRTLLIAGLLSASCTQSSARPTTTTSRSTPKPATAPASTTGEPIALGDVSVAISGSRTATLFHVVDQLSVWSPYAHKQYAAWAPPPHTADADRLLERHAALRGRLGRERGLEKIFYLSTTSPREAAQAAKRAGILTEAETDDEASALETWSSILDPHLASHAADEVAAVLREESPRFANLTRRWLAIGDVPAPSAPIPIVVVPSPGKGLGGGGANGGVLVIEVPSNAARATLTTVGHELVHIILRPKWDRFEKAAARCGKAKVDAVALSEAIAYAMAPGLFAYSDGIGQLEAIEAKHRGTDHPYALFSRTALALRPTVTKVLVRADAGERGMLDELLDAACMASSS